MKTKKIVGILLFLMGFGLVLYPMISRTYYDIHTRQETKQINTNIANDERSERLYNQQLAYNHSEITNPKNIEVPEVTFIEEPIASNTEDYTDNSGNSSVESGTSDNQTNFLVDENILGTISIPKIDIVYPIYDGATHENLLIGVARIEGTSYPVGGMDTNSVIAGHNGMVGKVYFSFIKEMVSGDIIEIQNRKELLTYEVYKTTVIEPDDSAALAVIPGQDTLTLLTCTWPAPGTHRYLVFARRIPNESGNKTVRDASNQVEAEESIVRNIETVDNITTEETTKENTIIKNLEINESINQMKKSDKSFVATAMDEIFEKVHVVTTRYGTIILMILIGIISFYFIFIR